MKPKGMMKRTHKVTVLDKYKNFTVFITIRTYDDLSRQGA